MFSLYDNADVNDDLLWSNEWALLWVLRWKMWKLSTQQSNWITWLKCEMESKETQHCELKIIKKSSSTTNRHGESSNSLNKSNLISSFCSFSLKLEIFFSLDARIWGKLDDNEHHMAMIYGRKLDKLGENVKISEMESLDG